MHVADTLFVSRTGIATMLSVDNNEWSTLLSTTSTSLGAGAPRLPLVFTVDGARMGVAIGRIG